MPIAPCAPMAMPPRFKDLRVTAGLTLLLVGLLGLTACTPPVSTPHPSASPASARYEALVMDTELKPLQNVRLRFWHPLHTALERSTDAAGHTDLSGLKSGTTYQVAVEGPEIVPQQRSVWLPAGKALRLRFFLERRQAELTGSITDPEGQAIAGAVLVSGEISVESDTQGQISLPLSQKPAKAATVFKQGYTPGELSPGQTIRLTPLNQNLRLRLAPDTEPLGLSPEAFARITTRLRTASERELLDWSETGPALDPARDTVWLASPAKSLSVTRRQELNDFVLAGGKLILSAEWAGFAAQSPDSLQTLLSGFGLALGNDSLHQSKQLEIRLFAEAHPLLTGITQLALYQSASVRSLHEPAQVLAYSPADGWRIAAEGGQGVIASTLAGKGKVLVLGDSSLWLDDDSDGDGRSNFDQADNARLWQNALSW